MWVKVTNSENLKDNSTMSVQIEKIRILLVRANNSLFALEDKCPHQEQSLEGGEIVDGKLIVCPWHSVTVDLKTGKVVNDMGFLDLPPVKTFDIIEKDGYIYIELKE